MDASALMILEIILAGVTLVVGLLICSVYVRRRLISHGSDVVACGFRPGRSGRWHPALLRMSATALEVFPLFGWSVRPTYSWHRRSVDLGVVSSLDDEVLGSAVDVQGRGRKVAASGATEAGERMQFDLALAPMPYTALRYWVESAPPTSVWAV